MKRRTLDIFFSIGGLGLAALLLIAGTVLTSNADFAKNYVRQQLSQQRITFTVADELTPEEQQSACVVSYAGQALKTGKQAECYANEFIGLHLAAIPNTNGKTYAQLGDDQAALRLQIAAAQPNNDPAGAGLQQQLTDITTAREVVFKGETLRGLLLTSYGFSVLGVKGAQVATVLYLAAALLLLLSIAGFLHAAVARKKVAFAAPEHAGAVAAERTLPRVAETSGV